MTRYEIEALRIADAGIEAGHSLWGAIDAANIRREVLAFECALEQISEEIENDHERTLFEASAMRAIPKVMLAADVRAEITSAYDRAWMLYVVTLRDSELDDVADHRADIMREDAA
jgi:predicted type IV restriction endonuclease